MPPRLTQQRLLARCPRRAIALASGHSVERLRDLLGVDPATFDRFIPKPFDPRALAAWLDGREGIAAPGADQDPAGVRIIPVQGPRLPPTPVWRRRLEAVV